MKTKAKTSKKSRSAGRNAGRKQPKRRSMGKSRRSRSAPSKAGTLEILTATLVEEAPITAQQADPTADKRDDELTDEESLDREERQELY